MPFKRLSICAVFIGLMIFARAQTVINNQVVIGKTDSVYSAILKEERTVWVYLPDGYKAGKDKYPVIYLLDAEWNFAAFTGMVHELSEVIGNTVYPQCIIVSIPNTDRTRDLTPTHATTGPDGKYTEGMQTSGGGENFTAFLQKELMPHIDSAYRTAPYKILVGHSFGGLTAMNIFVHHTELFNSYLVIDPSMWWDSRKLLDQTKDALKQRRFEGKSLYLGIANTMAMGMDTGSVRKDTAFGFGGHIRAILLLRDALQANHSNGLHWSYKYYAGDSHGSVPLIAEYDGLHFLLGFYDFPPGFTGSLFDKSGMKDPAKLISEHYDDVSKHMGYTVLPPEEMIKGMGYYILMLGSPEKTLSLFSLNVKNYPKSAGALETMGDYYAGQKDNDKAAEYYKKSLALSENTDVRKKLDGLAKK
jgi:predicted alpha/beta superfamily hydrolase